LLMEDWMYRKAEENAHNEILAFLMTILGVNLLLGGLIVAILVAGELSWFLIFPYALPQKSSAYIGLILTFTGFLILSAGFILVIHYDRKRRWYIKEIEKSSLPKKWKKDYKTVNQILEEYVGKRKKESS
jgi:heme/copper-type cytochrome/quinol oxidase subunit 1